MNGKYVWGIQANKGVFWSDTSYLAGMGKGDFYLSVEATKTNGPADADCRLILRSDGGRYYSFAVNANGFGFSLYDKTWKTLQKWTASSAIRTGTGQPNRLAVLVEGSHFSLFINDTLVGEVTDDTLQGGSAGLAVELEKQGDKARFEFDNFELRRRPS